MAINLAKNYAPILDEIYKNASVTDVLTSDASIVREGANAHEILVPKMTVTGLGNYSRSSGYTDGAVSVEWETISMDYDRGEKITVDTMDDEETFEIALGQAFQQLMKNHVAPEADAYTFAKLAGTANIGGTTGTLSTGDDVLAALVAGNTAMDEAEVTAEGRILFITPTLFNKLQALESYKFKEILGNYAQVVKVPQSRFYTAIDLKAGTADAGYGYAKHASTGGSDAAGQNINFMIVEPSALVKFDKHIASNVISPDANPNADAYIVKYRKYGVVRVYDNKTAGIYCHSVA